MTYGYQSEKLEKGSGLTQIAPTARTLKARCLFSTVVAGAALLSGGGCDLVAESGTFGYGTEAAFEEALSGLFDKPSISLSGTVSGFAVEGDSTIVDFNVADTGVAYGTATIDGTPAKMMLVDDFYYLNSSWDFWDSYGFSEEFSEKVDNKWTPVDPEVWPGLEILISAKEYVRALRSTLAVDLYGSGKKLPTPVESDGVKIHSFPVGDGSVEITASIPHRLVAVESVEVDLGYGTVVEAQLSVGMKKLSDKYIKKWMGELGNAIEDLTTVYSDAYVPFTEDDEDMTLSCNSTSCVTKAKMDTSEIGEALTVADEVTVAFTSTVKAKGVETEKCTAEVTVPVGEIGTASCEVDFGKVEGGLGDVEANLRTSDVVEFSPDVDGMLKDLKADLKDVLARA